MISLFVPFVFGVFGAGDEYGGQFVSFVQERVSLYNTFGNPDLLTSVLSPAEINTLNVLWWVHWLSGQFHSLNRIKAGYVELLNYLR